MHMIKQALVFAVATAAIHGPAFATQNITLPNGVNVPYAGQSAPTFYATPNPGTPGATNFAAVDSATNTTYYYAASGTWLGVSGQGAANVANAPVIPTAITLPANSVNPNGLTIPYNGGAVPQMYVDADGNYTIVDAVRFRVSYLGADGSFRGAGGWFDYLGTPLTGSSGWNATSSGVVSTTSGVTSSGCVSNCGGSSGGGTDVPGPSVFGLLGLAGAGVAFARRRRQKVKV